MSSRSVPEKQSCEVGIQEQISELCLSDATAAATAAARTPCLDPALRRALSRSCICTDRRALQILHLHRPCTFDPTHAANLDPKLFLFPYAGLRQEARNFSGHPAHPPSTPTRHRTPCQPRGPLRHNRPSLAVPPLRSPPSHPVHHAGLRRPAHNLPVTRQRWRRYQQARSVTRRHPRPCPTPSPSPTALTRAVQAATFAPLAAVPTHHAHTHTHRPSQTRVARPTLQTHHPDLKRCWASRQGGSQSGSGGGGCGRGRGGRR